MIKKLFAKYGDLISYLFFGVCTTLVNVVSYWGCAHLLHMPTINSTIIAWILAVAFAYVTNRKWVFHSKAHGRAAIIREICSFVVCRLFTGLLDIAIMYVFVDRLHCNDVVVKIISNIVVIIVNYIASKLFIFNAKNNNASVAKKSLIVAALLLISFSLAQLSEWGLWKHKDGYIDANVYKYVGQVIRDGGMPYKDVFDHKGPLMYLLQAWGGYINEYSGEWIFEFAAIFVTICAFYKIARLLKCKSWQALLATIVPMTLLKTMYGGTFGAGACCCLFAMPFVSVSLYVFLKYFVTGKVKNLSIWLCGLCCGSVLMLRPNIIAVWAVFCIGIAIKTIREKQFSELWRFIGFFILGLATAIAPMMVWLAANGAFADFIDQFFGFNFFYSSKGVSMPSRADAALFFLSFEIIAFAFVYMVYRIVVHREKLDIYCGIFFAINIALASMSGHAWHHYAIMLFPSLIYPYATLFAKLPSRVKKGKKLVYLPEQAPIIIVTLVALAITVVPTWTEILRSDVVSYANRGSSLNDNDPTTRDVMALVAKYTNEGDKIQAFGHMPVFYNVTNRRAATRFMFFTTQVASYKNNRAEFFDTLEAEKPKIVISSPIDYYDEDLNAFLADNGYNLIYPEGEDGAPHEPSRDDTASVYVFYRPADKK